MMFRLVFVLVPLLTLGASELVAQGDETLPAGESHASDFLEALEGQWNMRGRFRFSQEADWLATGSTMIAKRDLAKRALIREIEAKQIGFTALDIIWYDESAEEYTYVYLNSASSVPVIMKGRKTGEGEISVRSADGPDRTVISLIDRDEMVARDFQLDADGNEWMSREVFHYRVTAP